MKKIRYDSKLYTLLHLPTCVKNYKLVKKYPFLKPRYCDKYNYSWTSYDSIPPGWQKAFGLMMMDDIMAACKNEGIDPSSLYVIECKEKWGRLIFELNNMPDSIADILQAYEHVSSNICFVCGKLDVPITNFGWIVPICKNCYSENDSRKKQYENFEKNLTKEDYRIPDYYTVKHFKDNTLIEKKVDVTWITDRLRLRRINQ